MNNDSCLNIPCTIYTAQHHDIDDTMTINSDQGKPGHQIHLVLKKLKMTPTPENNTQGLGEQMHCNDEVTQVSTMAKLTNLKIPIH